MDIEVFEQLETIAKSDSNEERIMLRQFQKKDSYKELGTINQRIVEMEKDEKELSDKAKKIDEQIDESETKKYDLVKKLYKIDESGDIEELLTIQRNFNMERQQLKTQLKDDKEYKETLRPLYMEYHSKLAKIDEEEIQEEYEEWKELKDKVRDIKTQMKLLESKTKSLNHHNEDLMKFTYDENCEYCIKNGKEQIHEQEEIQSQLMDLDDEYKSWETQYKIKSYAFEKLDGADERNKEYHIFYE